MVYFVYCSCEHYVHTEIFSKMSCTITKAAKKFIVEFFFFAVSSCSLLYVAECTSQTASFKILINDGHSEWQCHYSKHTQTHTSQKQKGLNGYLAFLGCSCKNRHIHFTQLLLNPGMLSRLLILVSVLRKKNFFY